jgi:hypothetical protein
MHSSCTLLDQIDQLKTQNAHLQSLEFAAGNGLLHFYRSPALSNPLQKALLRSVHASV